AEHGRRCAPRYAPDAPGALRRNGLRPDFSHRSHTAAASNPDAPGGRTSVRPPGRVTWLSRTSALRGQRLQLRVSAVEDVLVTRLRTGVRVLPEGVVAP